MQQQHLRPRLFRVGPNAGVPAARAAHVLLLRSTTRPGSARPPSHRNPPAPLQSANRVLGRAAKKLRRHMKAGLERLQLILLLAPEAFLRRNRVWNQCFWFRSVSWSSRDRKSLRIGEVFDVL